MPRIQIQDLPEPARIRPAASPVSGFVPIRQRGVDVDPGVDVRGFAQALQGHLSRKDAERRRTEEINVRGAVLQTDAIEVYKAAVEQLGPDATDEQILTLVTEMMPGLEAAGIMNGAKDPRVKGYLRRAMGEDAALNFQGQLHSRLEEFNQPGSTATVEEVFQDTLKEFKDGGIRESSALSAEGFNARIPGIQEEFFRRAGDIKNAAELREVKRLAGNEVTRILVGFEGLGKIEPQHVAALENTIDTLTQENGVVRAKEITFNRLDIQARQLAAVADPSGAEAALRLLEAVGSASINGVLLGEDNALFTDQQSSMSSRLDALRADLTARQEDATNQHNNNKNAQGRRALEIADGMLKLAVASARENEESPSASVHLALESILGDPEVEGKDPNPEILEALGGLGEIPEDVRGQILAQAAFLEEAYGREQAAGDPAYTQFLLSALQDESVSDLAIEGLAEDAYSSNRINDKQFDLVNARRNRAKPAREAKNSSSSWQNNVGQPTKPGSVPTGVSEDDYRAIEKFRRNLVNQLDEKSLTAFEANGAPGIDSLALDSATLASVEAYEDMISGALKNVNDQRKEIRGLIKSGDLVAAQEAIDDRDLPEDVKIRLGDRLDATARSIASTADEAAAIVANRLRAQAITVLQQPNLEFLSDRERAETQANLESSLFSRVAEHAKELRKTTSEADYPTAVRAFAAAEVTNLIKEFTGVEGFVGSIKEAAERSRLNIFESDFDNTKRLGGLWAQGATPGGVTPEQWSASDDVRAGLLQGTISTQIKRLEKAHAHAIINATDEDRAKIAGQMLSHWRADVSIALTGKMTVPTKLGRVRFTKEAKRLGFGPDQVIFEGFGSPFLGGLGRETSPATTVRPILETKEIDMSQNLPNVFSTQWFISEGLMDSFLRVESEAKKFLDLYGFDVTTPEAFEASKTKFRDAQIFVMKANTNFDG